MFQAFSISIFNIEFIIDDNQQNFFHFNNEQIDTRQSTNVCQQINHFINSTFTSIMIENNFQNFDFNQQQFLIIQQMIQKAVIDVIDVVDIADFLDFSKSSKSQNTSASSSDNLFVDR